MGLTCTLHKKVQHFLPIKINIIIFNTCIILTYDMERMTFIVESNRVRTSQRAIEKTLLGVSLRDHTQKNKILKTKSQR